MNKIVLPPEDARPLTWPEGLTRVPYWVFQDQAVYAEEQRKLFQGPNWHYLALEVELAEAGDEGIERRTDVIGVGAADLAPHAGWARCETRAVCEAAAGEAQAVTRCRAANNLHEDACGQLRQMAHIGHHAIVRVGIHRRWPGAKAAHEIRESIESRRRF